MSIDELKKLISNITIWKKGDQRAPHKPLLILYAMGKLQQGYSRLLEYEEVAKDLKQLLVEFGPIRKSYHPEEPFVRLTRDGIWELNQQVNLSDPNHRLLIEQGVQGGFTSEVYNFLKDNKHYIPELSLLILEQHFPASLHEDILDAVGLNLSIYTKRKRDTQFRNRILRIYSYKCAICGFDVRLGNTLVALEAAHIKWHQAGGPDIETNGLALCSMHHKLFDRGVFSINQDKKIIVSKEAHGNNGFEDWLMKFHGKVIMNPIEPIYEPKDEFIYWHMKEVFKGPQRYL